MRLKVHIVLKALYTNRRLYLISSLLVVLFVLGQFFDGFFLAAKIAWPVFVLFLIIDAALLFRSRSDMIALKRILPDKLSNGDENPIDFLITNQSPFRIHLIVIDEIPAQFQIRDFKLKATLNPQEEKAFRYYLTPLQRGEYFFGFTNVFVSSRLGLWCRRFKCGSAQTMVPVYPSFLKFRQYERLAISNRSTQTGTRKIRRAGTFSEFDQIKDYVLGDNYRTINWKATARRSKLMVNQYQEERSQPVYNLIDMGRNMQAPFGGMSLLDYAINSALIFSNTALVKYDKAGLITFNKKVETFIQAERGTRTLGKFSEFLYNLNTEYFESDFAGLAAFVRRHITHRSLLVLYTNFETISSLHRQLSYFKALAKSHLLLVVIFENREMKNFSDEKVRHLEDVYIKTIAEKMIFEKKLIVKELHNHGILSILSRPEELSVKLINQYIGLKQDGRI